MNGPQSIHSAVDGLLGFSLWGFGNRAAVGVFVPVNILALLLGSHVHRVCIFSTFIDSSSFLK